MPKKKKKRKKKITAPLGVRKIFDLVKTEGQEYAKVTALLGNRRVTLDCMDGKKRLGRIRGNMKKKRIFINKNDYVLISLRDFQDEKADLLDKYTPQEVKRLIRAGEMAEDKAEEEEEDIGVDFQEEENINLDEI
jgi:translation initiation factor 1A